MKNSLSRKQIQEKLDLVLQHGHSDRFGKFSNNKHSCIYVWKVTKFTVEYETIDNGIRTGLYTETRARFVTYMLKTNSVVHWTVGA